MDLISRQAAIEEVEFGITYAKAFDMETGEVRELFKASNEELRKAVERIKALPTADLSEYCDKLWKTAYERGKAEAQPRKGRWISETKGKVAILDEFGNVSCSAHCSECGDWLTASDEYSCRGNYCPNCGARMEESE